MHQPHQHQRCIHQALNNAANICRQRNKRLTPIRKRVLEILWQSHAPIKAYAILDQLNQENLKATPPTVYRSLDFLLQLGLAHKLNSLNAYIGCSHPQKQHGCYFLICNSCGEISECCNENITQAVSKTALINNFKLKELNIEIKGVCNLCLH